MLTIERIDEIAKAQSQFPHWGNYQKFMTPIEIREVLDYWDKMPNGNSSFASALFNLRLSLQDNKAAKQ